MKPSRTIALFFSALLLCTATVQAQSIKELEAKKKKTLEELALTNKMLGETQKNKKGTENKITLLKRSIRQSSEYINTLNGEIRILDRDIDSIQNSKKKHEQHLTQLREEYAQTTRAIYNHHKYFSPLLFILSADNFNQAYRRFRYMQQVASNHKMQAKQIESITITLSEQQNRLTENRIQKESAISAKEKEQQKLESQRKEQASQLSSLSKKEKQLKEKQKKQQQQANTLNKKIENMIAAEIKKQEETAHKKTSGSKYQMSKEEKLVAGNFEANKGKLPRPVEKGFISGHFGIQPHPILDKVTINNKGIYLQTPAGTDARAVFEGEVTQCFSVPGSNQSVIVKHGNYRTVYSNLSTIYVKIGDKITTKQKIGKIFTDTENDNKTELYFMLYKDTEIQNPEIWLLH
ncbi:MAG: murein hydrolase activator EnvC family protein [Candidatus Aphodosoma sp.]